MKVQLNTLAGACMGGYVGQPSDFTISATGDEYSVARKLVETVHDLLPKLTEKQRHQVQEILSSTPREEEAVS